MQLCSSTATPANAMKRGTIGSIEVCTQDAEFELDELDELV